MSSSGASIASNAQSNASATTPFCTEFCRRNLDAFMNKVRGTCTRLHAKEYCRSALEATAWSTGSWLAAQATIAVGAILACLLVELALIPVGLDVVDEGYFAQQAPRLLGGQVPYRDVHSRYTPGLLYQHAALLALLGGPHV